MRINYSSCYKNKEKTNFEEKILSGEKVHTIRRTNWGAKEGCVLDHGKRFGGAGFKRSSFLINRCFCVQKVKIIFKKDKIVSIKIDGNETPLSLVAKNDGLTNKGFEEWFCSCKENNVFNGFLIHWTDLKY